MRYFKFADCEVYKMPQGRIFIGHSSKDISFGFLELNPGQKLERHNRPVDEELIQIEGECTLSVFDGKPFTEFRLTKGDYLKIPANIFHIHENKSARKSLTLWKFEGDITSIINQIKSSSNKNNFS